MNEGDAVDLVQSAIWMMTEIDRVHSGSTDDLTPMIEINGIICDGLK